MGEPTTEFESALLATADEVWDHVSTMAGVNDELAPWVRMTVPRGLQTTRLSDVTVGREAFTSVLLFLGIVPFDRHHLTLQRIYDRGFDEESWSWLQRRWRHERRVEPTATGCLVTDRLTVCPRLAPAGFVVPLVRRLFAARHKKLRARFGVAAR